jgi:hypothetical protein
MEIYGVLQHNNNNNNNNIKLILSLQLTGSILQKYVLFPQRGVLQLLIRLLFSTLLSRELHYSVFCCVLCFIFVLRLFMRYSVYFC